MVALNGLLLFSSVLYQLVKSDALPTVNLGYEIHQATFNVRYQCSISIAAR